MAVAEVLFSSERMDWRTPESILQLVSSVAVNGRIGLDPATELSNPTKADHWIAPPSDGLQASWRARGLVFINPPYGREICRWTRKMRNEAAADPDGEYLALVPGRVDTRWWHEDVLTASAICLWRGRIRFVPPDGFVSKGESAAFPSAFVYWGARSGEFRRVFEPHGWVIQL